MDAPINARSSHRLEHLSAPVNHATQAAIGRPRRGRARRRASSVPIRYLAERSLPRRLAGGEHARIRKNAPRSRDGAAG